MSDLDFLPQWYIDMNRRKRRLRIQLGVAIILGLSVLGWSLMTNRQLRQTRLTIESRKAAVALSEQRVEQRSVQQALRDQLRAQDRVESSLGLNVEASRLLALIANALPASASILELEMDTEEQNRPLLQQVVDKRQSIPIDRQLKFKLSCVAPANIDVATLLENLTNSGVCEGLRLGYARERVADGIVMREFSVEFKVNLLSENEAR